MRSRFRGIPIAVLLSTTFVLGSGSLSGQGSPSNFALDPQSPLPRSWERYAASCGIELHLPRGFRRVRKTHRYRRLALQGELGGARVRVHVNRWPGSFQTISRILTTISGESTLKDVFVHAGPNGPIALVRRRNKNPTRTVLELVTCPRHRGTSVEVEFLSEPGPQSISLANRVLSHVRVAPPRGLTVARSTPELKRQSEIELGFVPEVRGKIEVVESAHYRLYSSAAGSKKLLDLLETELLPQLRALLGPIPKRLAGGRLAVFLHRTKQEYLASGLAQGISVDQMESMDGYAWNRYYSTSYSSPRAPIHLHEGTHQYVTAVLGLDGGGPWLQEGIAEVIQCDFEHSKPVRVARNLLKRRGRGFITLRELVGAKTFLGNAQLQARGFGSTHLYAIAAALIDYLRQRHGIGFRRLMLQAGALPPGHPDLVDAAMRRSLQIDLTTLERRWHAWLRGGR